MAVNERLSYKIIIDGANFVGKSAFTVMLVQGVFVNKYDPTISESYRKLISVEGKDIMIEFIDISESESAHMRQLLYRGADMGVLMYSITDDKSFDALRTFYKQIQEVREKDKLKPLLIAIFGNKSDLEDERKVNTEQVAELAASLNCPFFEGSTKSNHNLNETLRQLVHLKLEHDANPKNNNKRKKKRECIIV